MIQAHYFYRAPYCYNYILIYLKLCLAIILLFGFFNKAKEINSLCIFTLFIELISILVSIFTNKIASLQPFFLTYYQKNWPYPNLIFLLIVSILLLLYKGIDDNLIFLHKFLVAIYLFISAFPYILLL